MPYMEKEIVVSLDDIRYIEISCQHCTTRLILDMKEPHQYAKEKEVFIPDQCPGCRSVYDTAIRGNVDKLRKVYSDLLKISTSIHFRGKAEVVVNAIP